MLDGGLEEALLQLQPLGGLLHPRVLVVSTALEGWSAVFDDRDRKSTRLNSVTDRSRMPSSA